MPTNPTGRTSAADPERKSAVVKPHKHRRVAQAKSGIGRLMAAVRERGFSCDGDDERGSLARSPPGFSSSPQSVPRCSEPSIEPQTPPFRPRVLSGKTATKPAWCFDDGSDSDRPPPLVSDSDDSDGVQLERRGRSRKRKQCTAAMDLARKRIMLAEQDPGTASTPPRTDVDSQTVVLPLLESSQSQLADCMEESQVTFEQLFEKKEMKTDAAKADALNANKPSIARQRRRVANLTYATWVSQVHNFLERVNLAVKRGWGTLVATFDMRTDFCFLGAPESMCSRNPVDL